MVSDANEFLIYILLLLLKMETQSSSISFPRVTLKITKPHVIQNLLDFCFQCN